ncbi:MAG TPA: helix-hairpin-helix domain-containing protein [Longimicrobiales bacterium]
MSLTRDERRALSFVALLLVLAAGARLARRDEAVAWPGDAVDADSLAAAARERLEDAERRARPLAPGERIDPNVAPEAELDRLPGVGPALARRIIAARQAGGPFRSIEDLARVRGIGESTLHRLAPHLRFAAKGAVVRGAGAREVFPTAPGASGVVGADAVPTAVPVASAGRGSGSGPAGAERRGARVGRAGASGRAAAVLDLNRATAAELESLPGLGPALAARIVAYRDSVGAFADVAELVRVRGIGPATLERLRPRLRVRP